MTALAAAPELELDGPQVRRLTSRSAAARATTTLWTRLLDAWSAAATTAIGLAMLGGWLASVRDTIGSRPPIPGSALPPGVTAAVVTVVAVAGLVGVLDRLGPVSASPAAAAWWLPLPASRRGLLRAELARVAGACAGVTALLSVPLFLTWTARPSVAGILLDVAGAGVTAAGLVGAVALLETRGATSRVAPVAGAVAVVVSAAATVAAAVAPVARATGDLSREHLPAVGPLWVPGAAVAAAVLLGLADRGLGRLRARTLRLSGSTAQYAAASVLSLDTRDLGRALAARRQRPVRRRWRFRPVTRAWQAVAAADLLLLLRSPWQLGQLVVAVAVPVVASRTDGLDRLPPAVWGGLLLGWALAAVSVGHPARHASAASGTDRLVPLSAAQAVATHCAVPALALCLVGATSGLLIGAGGGSALAWAGLGVAAVPAWTAAAVRGGYRPELDWTGPVMSTPMGTLPAGVGATLVQGLDVGIVGSVPAIVAVHLSGAPSWSMVAGQLLWALAVGAGGLALTVHRLTSARD
jgi:hypothetical protein